MSRRNVTIIAIVGVVLFVIGLLGWLAFRQARAMALSVDSGNLLQPPIEGPGCPELTAVVNLERRVMTENESQALVVNLSLPEGINCAVTVSLLAPNFLISPPETSRVATVPAGSDIDVAWVISPQDVGTYEVVIVVDERSETRGITVTNTLGLTATQAQILSIIASFLGPMLTAPWWYERWRERKKEKEEAARRKAKEEEAENTGRPGGRTLPFE